MIPVGFLWDGIIVAMFIGQQRTTIYNYVMSFCSIWHSLWEGRFAGVGWPPHCRGRLQCPLRLVFGPSGSRLNDYIQHTCCQAWVYQLLSVHWLQKNWITVQSAITISNHTIYKNWHTFGTWELLIAAHNIEENSHASFSPFGQAMELFVAMIWSPPIPELECYSATVATVGWTETTQL